MLGPTTRLVREARVIDGEASRRRAARRATRSWRVTSQPSSAGSHDDRLVLAQLGQHRGGGRRASCATVTGGRRGGSVVGHRVSFVTAAVLAAEADQMTARKAGRSRPGSNGSSPSRSMPATRSRSSSSASLPGGSSHSPSRSDHPGGERGERLDLDVVLPPARADRQVVALAQGADIVPEVLKPQPALARVQPAPGQRPARRPAPPGRRPRRSQPRTRVGRPSGRLVVGRHRQRHPAAAPGGSWRRQAAQPAVGEPHPQRDLGRRQPAVEEQRVAVGKLAQGLGGEQRTPPPRARPGAAAGARAGGP